MLFGEDVDIVLLADEENDELRRLVWESLPSSSSSSSSSRRRFSASLSGGVCETVGLALEEEGEVEVEFDVEGEGGEDLRDCGGEEERRFVA